MLSLQKDPRKQRAVIVLLPNPQIDYKARLSLLSIIFFLSHTLHLSHISLPPLLPVPSHTYPLPQIYFSSVSLQKRVCLAGTVFLLQRRFQLAGGSSSASCLALQEP